MDAIIGHTGFIGQILKKKIIGHFFNRSNINDINNNTYNIVYCSGIPSSKWIANKNPLEDSQNINNLLKILKNVKCEKFVLISTISVYDNEPYGINRKNFENSLIEIFGEKLLIVRLPAVYGEGLKKNLLFDMLNNTLMDKINEYDTYQWYNVNNIKSDIDYALINGEDLIELYPEPINNFQLMSLFNKKFDFISDNKKVNIQNIVPKNGYLYSSDRVIKELKEFINGYR
jgi:hypothetical protein